MKQYAFQFLPYLAPAALLSAAQYLLSAIADAMVPPTEKDSRGYQFRFRLLQRLAANKSRLNG